MAFEIPTDLIREVQITLREEAGLSSYDPSDPTLPPIPSLGASIAQLDPSPPYLLCKHCKGKLLRGVQSIICIYCGKQQQEVPPDPIPFKSTFGGRWLLDSLGLNGSEIVRPFVEESESRNGQDKLKDEISLSDLLDIKLCWSSEPENSETDNAKGTAEQRQSSLNLIGVDFDNFFESKRDAISSTFGEPLATRKLSGSTETKESVEDRCSLFPNVGQYDTVVRSSQDENANAFSGWEADFQSANSGNQQNEHVGPKTFDAFTGPTPDLSSHIDSVFEHGKGTEGGALNFDFQSAYSENQPQGSKSFDPFISSSMADFSSPLESVFGPGNDRDDRELKDNFTSGDSLLQPEGPKSDDIFMGSTSDFSSQIDLVFGSGMNTESEKPNNDPVLPPSASNDWIQSDLWNSASAVVPQQLEEFDATNNNKGDSVTPSKSNDRIQEDLWNNIGSGQSLEVGTVVAKDNSNNFLSPNIDWLQDAQWQITITNAPPKKTIDENDESFDDWNDFTSSTNSQQHIVVSGQALGPQQDDQLNGIVISKDGLAIDYSKNFTSPNIDWLQDAQLEKNITDAPKKKIDENDDFDNWNDFTSSTNSQQHHVYSGNALVPQQVDQLNGIVIAKDGLALDSSKNFLSPNIDWLQDAQLKINITDAHKKKIDENDDSFDDWNDFTSSTNSQKHHVDSGRTSMPQQVDQLNGTVNIEDGSAPDNSSKFLSPNIAPKKVVDEKYDSFDDCNDYTSSTNSEQHVVGGGQALVPQQVDKLNVSVIGEDYLAPWQRNMTDAPEKIIDEFDDSFDEWNDFTSSTNSQQHHVGTSPTLVPQEVDQLNGTVIAKDGLVPYSSNNFSSQNMDSLQDAQWQINITNAPGKIIDKNDDSFDDWNDFTSSTNSQHHPVGSDQAPVPHQVDQLNGTVIAKDGSVLDSSNNFSSPNSDWLQDAQWQINITGAFEKIIDDSFDDWNDFTSSTNSQGHPLTSHLTPSNDVIASVEEINPSVSKNIQENDFDVLSQPDIFSGSIRRQNGSIKTSSGLSEFRALDSTVGDSAGQTAKNDVTSSAQPKDDAKVLMSQMYDLSFILESNLSVPSKVDGHHSSSQD